MVKINVARLVSYDEELQVGQADKPTPGPLDVLVKVEASGIVPNTLNIVSGKSHRGLVPEMPTVFGLDAAGVIESVGEHVVGLEPGQRVYVDPYLTCETCPDCRRGRIELCAAGSLRGYLSNTPMGKPVLKRYPFGGMSEYVVAPARNIAVLPANVEMLLAARLGYIGTSYAGLKRGRLGPGKTLLINGVTGTLGVAAVAIALGMGATKILGVGRNRELLTSIEELAPHRIKTVSLDDVTDLSGWARGLTDGWGVDTMYDCLGLGADSKSTTDLLKAVRPGGRAILVAGGVHGIISQSYVDTYADVSVSGSMWFNSGEIDELLALLDSGVIDFSFMEHRTYPLSQVNEAIRFGGTRPGGFVNTVVLPGASFAGDHLGGESAAPELAESR